MANSSTKATAPKAAASEPPEPLVNESEEQLSAPELILKLRDSREEARRTRKQVSEFQESHASQDETITKLHQQLEELSREKTLLASEKEKLEEANRILEASPNVQTDSGGVEAAGYSGPSQSEIYLALVSGFTSSIDPLKQLDDQKVAALSKSVCGLSEVFFKEAARRPSFNK